MLHAPTLKDRQFRRRVADFLAVEQEQASVRPLRLGLIGAGVLLMLYFGGSPWVALIAPIYFLSDLTYVRHVARVHRAARVTSRMLFALLTHHGVTVLAFGAFAVVNAFWPTAIAAWSAGLLVFGQALNCIGHDTRSQDAARIGAVIVGLGAQLTIAGFGYSKTIPASDLVFLHVSSFLVTIYFAAMVLNTARTRARLSERTEELAHAQKGEAVGRLTSGIAHDFNNLLTVMRGNIDLLSEVPESERDPLLREIGDATERGGRLVGRLLDASRRAPSDTRILDLAPFLDEFGTFARRILPANITLVIGASGPLWLNTDPSQCEAAMLNLVVNARDAMGRRGGIITLTAEMISSPSAPSDMSPWILLVVADDGPGMEPSVLARATEPFVTTKPPGEGTGLGLAMVMDFANRSGGTFEIESKVGQGTVARLRLPTA
ncbi:ATP-binding protein [uncultured Jannaschia sp.]|uniref:sensor histidine kinase n=1 Tax=uncultured Jannaschia sp. TaxID=293347 RepID=UPI00262E3BA1|nr:ATP-binding protein [uncultured Jannaschia sp.]